MKYNPDIHHRQSIRLRNFDYSASGAYFVTLCVQGRECLFGSVHDGVLASNEPGRMVEKWMQELTMKFDTVMIDAHIIMPNHFHGIIRIVGAPLCGCPVSESRAKDSGRPHRAAPTLGNVMDWFKTMTTNAYIQGVKQSDWPPFPGRLWQRNYY